ncbi:hypothetical protein D7Y13_26220, partial [Corallococcus praedator]
EHRHSAIRFVTPEARHFGLDVSLLAQRHQVYLRARARHPERWMSGAGVMDRIRVGQTDRDS